MRSANLRLLAPIVVLILIVLVTNGVSASSPARRLNQAKTAHSSSKGKTGT